MSRERPPHGIVYIGPVCGYARRGVVEELTSTTIVPIALYCFLLAGYFFYLAFNAILENLMNLGTVGYGFWSLVSLALLCCAGMVNVGIGFLNVRPQYWRILFFTLIIAVACTSSCIIAYFILLWVGIDPITLFDLKQVSAATWFSFLGVFLSAIIILYYLSHEEVIKYFGDPGPMLTPF